MVSRWWYGGQWNSYRLGLASGKVVFGINTASNEFIELESPSTTTYTDNEWHHVAGTYTSRTYGTVTLYVDGVQVSTTSGYGGLSTVGNTITQLVIGNDSRNLDDLYFNGAISDVRIWNVTRTLTDIASSYQYRLNGNEPGLVGYWKLDQANATGYPTTVTGFKDSTSNANNSTSIQFASPLMWDATIGFMPTAN